MAEKKKVKFEPLALIGDEPVSTLADDRLSLRNFAETVAAVSLGTEGPFTIGVFGRWGHGKTSLLRLAQSIVDDQRKDNVTTAWFNAWQYEHTDDIRAGLAHEVALGLLSDLGRWWWIKKIHRFWISIRFAWRSHFW
ncbi:MAG: hypothetical protein IID42_04865 [Planctomycetes bacterium]|nr:hypothetical protein [Planctomycetota bacterium]